jgi:hypothetical protein
MVVKIQFGVEEDTKVLDRGIIEIIIVIIV